MSTGASATSGQRRRIYPGLDQLVVRTLVVVGALTAVVAAQAAGARLAGWQQGALVALAVLTAIRPESALGAGLLCATTYTWALAPQTLSPLLLLAAAGMVLAHVSALLVAQGPPTMRLDRAQVLRWAGRAVGLWLAAAAVWGLAVAMADLQERRLPYALGLILLLVVAVVGTQRVSSRPDRAAPRG